MRVEIDHRFPDIVRRQENAYQRSHVVIANQANKFRLIVNVNVYISIPHCLLFWGSCLSVFISDDDGKIPI